MINQFGPESHGGHLGVEKGGSLMVALKRDKRGFRRVLTQKHSSAHPGADHGGAGGGGGRGQQRISCKLLGLLTQGKPASQGGNYGGGH